MFRKEEADPITVDPAYSYLNLDLILDPTEDRTDRVRVSLTDGPQGFLTLEQVQEVEGQEIRARVMLSPKEQASLAALIALNLSNQES